MPKFTRRQFAKNLIAAGLLAPAAMLPRQAKAQHSDVLIVGAGLAGMNAALTLKAEGYDVRVLEASNRTGGRIMTLDNLPGRPDAGGLQVGGGYAHFRSLCERFNVTLEPFPEADRSLCISVNGQSLSHRDWADSELNRLPDNIRHILPPRLLGNFIDASVLPDTLAWLDKSAHKLDVSLDGYLKNRGADGEARRLIGVTLNTMHIDRISALNEIRKFRAFKDEAAFGPSARVRGGTSRITDALAASLGEAIHTGKRVRQIDRSRNRFTASCRDGSRYSADALIVAAPFAALRHVAFTPALPGKIGRIVREIGYAPVTAFFLGVKQPFWEADGLGVNMWSDGLTERIFPLDDRQGGGHKILWGLINGPAAVRFDALPPDRQKTLLLEELAKLRPASKGHLEVMRIHSWTAMPFQGGAWSYWKPGQIRNHAETLHTPLPGLYFAGEHMAKFSAGMEAACASGARAAFQLMDDTAGV